MTHSPTPDVFQARDAALLALVEGSGLSETDAVNLSLENLHLGGREPYVVVWDEALEESRSIPLDEDGHRALVDWLLLRPDGVSSRLFVDEVGQALTETEVRQRVTRAKRRQTRRASQASAGPSPLSEAEIRDERLPDIVSLREASQPLPPPFLPRPPKDRPEETMTATGVTEEAVEAGPPPQPARAPTGEGILFEPTTLPPFEGPGYRPRSDAAWPEVDDEAGDEAGVVQIEATRFAYMPVITTAFLVICCVGGVALAILQGERLYNSFLGLLPGGGPTPVAEVAPTASPIRADSPIVPTPTMPQPEPSPTGSSLEPEPTPTAVVILPATATPTVPAPTDTPSPTESPAPAPTATPPPPSETATSVAAPPPVATSTPRPTEAAFKYAAPRLLTPQPNQLLIEGTTIDLGWEDFDLAGDEQYAVRLVYFHENEVVYRGQQVREPAWIVPFDLFRDADGPEFKYTWFVFVERVNPDGSTTPVSPESQKRDFYWR
jgi:hypothetical protein